MLSASPTPPDFLSTYKWDGRPFLLVGMGPSFPSVFSKDLTKYNVMGINKVVREIPVDICHIIDFYIVDKVKDSIDKQATHLVMPYYPHFGYRPHPLLPLRECMGKHKLFHKVMGYNLSTFPLPEIKSPIIEANYFTAEASLNLIAHLGCKEVYTVGIDGGKGERSKEFSDHGKCDPRGFDLQWPNMALTIKKFNLNYKNLDGLPLNPKLEELLHGVNSL